MAENKAPSQRRPNHDDKSREAQARSWIRIYRDFLTVTVGAFMLIHETMWSHSPNLYLVGGGLTAMGIPMALRLDEWIRHDPR